MSDEPRFRWDIFLGMTVGVPAVAGFLVALPAIVGLSGAAIVVTALGVTGLAWLVASTQDRVYKK
jgi:hypothetical protein